MKKLALILMGAFALISCRQTGTNDGNAPEHVSETGNNTSEEGSSGGVRVNPQANSNPDSTQLSTPQDKEDPVTNGAQ